MCPGRDSQKGQSRVFHQFPIFETTVERGMPRVVERNTRTGTVGSGKVRQNQFVFYFDSRGKGERDVLK